MEYFEDLPVGEHYDLGAYTAQREELIAFAERYDPQPIHLDPEAAAETMYGGLIASGWHTASATMRLCVDGFLNDAASLGSFGLSELRWERAVRPGDRVAATLEIADKTASSSREDRGYADLDVEATVDGETVLAWRSTNIFRRRQ
jgi:acyl dehydratase